MVIQPLQNWTFSKGFTKKIVDAVQANPDTLEGHGDLHHL
jgi:hypothetical protein